MKNTLKLPRTTTIDEVRTDLLGKRSKAWISCMLYKVDGPHRRGGGGADLLKTADPHSFSVFFFSKSKGLKTDKLPAHAFEIDEDAKDEVSSSAILDRRH